MWDLYVPQGICLGIYQNTMYDYEKIIWVVGVLKIKLITWILSYLLIGSFYIHYW